MPSWRTSASFLLCGLHLLKETMWWVPNQRSFKTVYVPSGKLTRWLARLWLSQAVIYAVRDFLPHLRSRVVRLMCDNAVTVAYIKNEGGTRSHTLMQLTIRLLKWCDRKTITLVPVHLPGVHNIQADSMSRVGQTLTTEWTMAMESLRPVFAKWGEPRIDLFATLANRRLIKFVSPYPDPRAEWTDAMSMPWLNCNWQRCGSQSWWWSIPGRSNPAVRRRSRPTDTRR